MTVQAPHQSEYAGRLRRAGILVGDACVLLAACGLLVGFVIFPARPVRVLPDFGSMEVATKKAAFLAFLSPVIAEVNDGFRLDRERLQTLAASVGRGDAPSWLERRWLRQTAERLEVPLDELPLEDAIALLERRAGTVPESIVLMQAAMESGWGTSRFAVEGNNLFGQRCYSPGCGIPPEGRPNARFGLAQFDSVEDSVESYVLNLNTHASYHDFRLKRQELLESGEPVTGLALVDELANYSERGEEYVDELRGLILQNGLE